MRTTRLLPVSPSMHCVRGAASGPWGGGWSRGVWFRGVSASGPGEGGVSQHARGQTPPLWTEFLTHASENITLPPTSLQAVTRKHSSRMRTTRLGGHH